LTRSPFSDISPNRKKGGLKNYTYVAQLHVVDHALAQRLKSVLAWDTPVGDMHERAILTGASIDFDEDSPAVIVA